MAQSGGNLLRTIRRFALDLVWLTSWILRSHQLAAENLFLRSSWPCTSNGRRSLARPITPHASRSSRCSVPRLAAAGDRGDEGEPDPLAPIRCCPLAAIIRTYTSVRTLTT